MASELMPNDLKGPDLAPQPAIFIVSATAPPAIKVANANVSNYNPDTFRRFGSARSLYNFNVDNAKIY